MLRDTGLHAALAIALFVLVGAILDNVPVGGAAGLLAGAVVTSKWPPRAVEAPNPVDAADPVDETATP